MKVFLKMSLGLVNYSSHTVGEVDAGDDEDNSSPSLFSPVEGGVASWFCPPHVPLFLRELSCLII